MKTKLPTFKKGDIVTWTSQAGKGYSKKKTGKVVEVIGPWRGMNDKHYDRFGSRPPGRLRNHRSYVVDVDGKLYWPLVKYLKVLS